MINLLQNRKVLVIVFALALFTMSARNVADPDVWWHLRTGQLILQNHSFFHTDPYSFTRFGQPWINHEWFSEVLLFSLYRVARFGGLIVVFGTVITTTFLLVFKRCPGCPYIAALITLWGAAASVPSWGIRPQMFSLLLASGFLILLEASNRRPALLWWTPPLMLLWVNLHGGYPIGLAFLLLFLTGEILEAAIHTGQWTLSAPRIRTLALVFAICLALVSLNPNGLRIYSYPFETLSARAMQRFIQEWSSPDFHDPSYAPFLLMLLALVAGLALSRRRRRIRDIVLLLATIPAALYSVRHIPIAVLVLTPALAGLAEARLSGRGHVRSFQKGQIEATTRTALLNALVLVTSLSFTVAWVRHIARQQGQIEAEKFPFAASAFLNRERPQGPILNHYNWGGYFIWKLYPQYRVFVDGRADVYGDQFIDAFAASYYLTGNWKQPIEQWGIQTIILPPDAPLVTALRSGPGWQMIYVDSQAVILSHRH